MTIRLNLSDDEAHALLHLLRRCDEVQPPNHRAPARVATLKRVAVNARTVRSKLERAERRRT